jgi:8-oxo-dGTP pyrophosphatase MutT (NUDIX family)
MTSSTSGPPTRLPGFDPETVPHDPDFADPARRGAPVPVHALAPDALRHRFIEPPVWTPEMRSDARLFDPTVEPRPASVLVPLVVRDGGVNVLLTQRTSHLTDHAGQISFPGGRVEESDADAVATALRESEEEIGLAASVVDVLGRLPEYRTVTGYRVTPVVALVERPFTLRLDTFEVAEAFEVPLAFLMDPANHERRLYRYADIARTFYAMPYTAARRYFIWGATAAMLRNFYHFLRA